jgi:sarcosine oxidase subunit alpha
VEAQRLLRLEKKHVIVGVDTDALTNPFEAGMAWVAKLDKPDFIGRAALVGMAADEMQQSLVGFVMTDEGCPDDGAAVMMNGQLAGRVTSARYSPVSRKAIGLAWIPAASAQEGREFSVRVNGRQATARVTLQAFYDAEGARLRT